MKRLLKLLLGLIGLLLVISVAAIITLANVDPNQHKGWIADQFHARTGRTLALKGDIHTSFYPWLGVEVNDVTVGNAPGFGSTPFLHADHAKVRVKLLPLLQDKYEVDTVQVRGLVVNLAVNKEGRSNWADLAGPPKAGPSPLPLAAVALGGVDIKDAALHWDDRSSGARYDITHINATTGKLVYGAPVKLNLSLRARANRPELDADVTMAGTLSYDLGKQQYRLSPLQINSVVRGRRIPGGKADLSLSAAMLADFDKETASITDLKIAGLDTTADGSVQIRRIRSTTPAVQTHLEVAGADLSLPFRILEIEPLASQLAGLKQRGFNFSTRLDADLKRGDVDVPELKARLLGADIEARVKATNVHSSTPAARGDVTASGPDLPTLLQVLGQFQTGKDKTLARYGRQLSRVGDKAFALKANFDADMNSGDINVPTLTVDGLGIHAAGNLKAKDMHSGKGSIQGRLTLNSDRIGEVLAALDKPDLGRAVRSVAFDAAVSGDRNDLNFKPMALKIAVGGKQIPQGDLTLDAATHVNLDKQQLDLDNLRLSGLGLNVHGTFHATDIRKSPRYSGELKVNPFDLRKLMRQLNEKPLETANKNALARVAVDTAFSGTADEIRIPRLTVSVDKSTLKGSLGVKDFKQPAIQAKLDVDQINLDDYLPPSAAGKPVTPETAAGAATRLPVKTLRTLNANVDLKAGRLVVSRLKLEDVTARLQGKDGLIELDPLAAKLYRGSYTGNIQINATGKLPKLTFVSTLKGVQMEPLLRDFTAKPAKLLGTGDLAMHLATAGVNTTAMKRDLAGNASLVVKKGVLMGIDIRKVMQQGQLILKTGRLMKVELGQKTEFDKLSASLVIKSGIVDNQDLIMSSPGIKVTGNGMLANLRNDSIKYNLKAAVDKSTVTRGGQQYELKGRTIPIECRGRYQSPSCHPDYDGLIKATVKKKAEDLLKKGLKDLFK